MMNLRCFVSVEFPEKLKKDISVLTEKLQAVDADVRWVAADNLHLTLKFLGSTPEELLPEIKELLARRAAGHPRFRLRLSGAGVFPSRRRPRVLWLGVFDSEGLIRLQRDIDGAMKELGFEPEAREFSPHLTLGRLKSPKGSDRLLRELDALKDAHFGEFDVAEASLMKSELKPTGAKYTRLHAFPLAPTPP